MADANSNFYEYWNDIRPDVHWGFKQLKLDEGLLEKGYLYISCANGILPDGTEFEIPRILKSPQPLRIDPNVHLGVAVLWFKLLDEKELEGDAQPVQPIWFCGDQGIYMPRVKAMRSIGVVKIAGISTSGRVSLDTDYIPPLLDFMIGPLDAVFAELRGLVSRRADELAASLLVDQSIKGNSTDIQLLQTLNRYEFTLLGLAGQSLRHPTQLLKVCCELDAELSTFSVERKLRPRVVSPRCVMHDLGGSFNRFLAFFRAFLHQDDKPIIAARLSLEYRGEPNRPYSEFTYKLRRSQLSHNRSLVIGVPSDLFTNSLTTASNMLGSSLRVGPWFRRHPIVSGREKGISVSHLALVNVDHPNFKRTWQYFRINIRAQPPDDQGDQVYSLDLFIVILGAMHASIELWQFAANGSSFMPEEVLDEGPTTGIPGIDISGSTIDPRSNIVKLHCAYRAKGLYTIDIDPVLLASNRQVDITIESAWALDDLKVALRIAPEHKIRDAVMLSQGGIVFSSQELSKARYRFSAQLENNLFLEGKRPALAVYVSCEIDKIEASLNDKN